MALIDEVMEEFVIMDRRTVPDGYGGVIPSYLQGAKIKAALSMDSSAESQVAQAMGSKSFYTIITSRRINLQYHDVVKRLSDGKTFRITSDGDDKKTPQSASLNMRAVTAEEWELAE